MPDSNGWLTLKYNFLFKNKTTQFSLTPCSAPPKGPRPLQGFAPLGGSIHRCDFPHLKTRLTGNAEGQITTRELHIVNPWAPQNQGWFPKHTFHFKQNNYRANQARSEQTFPFQNSIAFITNFSDYIHSITYSVTSYKSDTRSVTYLCLLKRNTDTQSRLGLAKILKLKRMPDGRYFAYWQSCHSYLHRRIPRNT